MGSGKSTYGIQLAEALGYSFLDLDAAVCDKTGMSIPELFRDGNESRFRKAEEEALHATESLENIVVATGGGAAAFGSNMQWMNEHGTTIYLKLFEPELINRLQHEKSQRPLIADLDEEQLQSFVYSTLRARAPFYTQAQITIDPLSLTPAQLAEITR
jgi:shikimate kinase